MDKVARPPVKEVPKAAVKVRSETNKQEEDPLKFLRIIKNPVAKGGAGIENKVLALIT